MALAFRLFQERFGPRDSTGARLKGGRWNSPGKDALYASDSLALCCLEVLTSEVLSQEFGDEFLDGASNRLSTLGMIGGPLDRFGQHAQPVQAVPSVVMPWGTHMNYLLNPLHDNFKALEWNESKAFEFEPRLLHPGLR